MKLIRYHRPPFVKHVLAPQNEFGIEKKYLVNLQKFWELGRPPPPCWEKFPNNPVIYFLSASPSGRIFLYLFVYLYYVFVHFY